MAYEFFKQLTEGKVHKHMDFQGMDISIEIPAGGKRTGTNKKTGEKWEHKIDDSYGYIKGTHSPDGEHLDCYVRKNPDKDAKVYVMHQLTVDGSKFDEDKVMLGYGSKAEATKAFKKFTFKPATMFGGVTEFDLDHFRLAAYQASRSHAILTNEETFKDFEDRGLLPHGVISSLTVAKRVCEEIEDVSEAIDFAATYFLDETDLLESAKAPVFSSDKFNWSKDKAVAEVSDLGLRYWPKMLGIKSTRTGNVLYFIPDDERSVYDAGGEDLIARVYISPGAGANVPEIHILND